MIELDVVGRKTEKPDEVYTDDRGEIRVKYRDSEKSVLRITSKAGTRRADHYHRHTTHVAFVESGHVEYLEHKVGTPVSRPMKSVIYGPGDQFYTASYVAHAMIFMEPAVLWILSDNPRTREAYEDDLVRLGEPLG